MESLLPPAESITTIPEAWGAPRWARRKRTVPRVGSRWPLSAKPREKRSTLLPATNWLCRQGSNFWTKWTGDRWFPRRTPTFQRKAAPSLEAIGSMELDFDSLATCSTAPAIDTPPIERGGWRWQLASDRSERVRRPGANWPIGTPALLDWLSRGGWVRWALRQEPASMFLQVVASTAARATVSNLLNQKSCPRSDRMPGWRRRRFCGSGVDRRRRKAASIGDERCRASRRTIA